MKPIKVLRPFVLAGTFFAAATNAHSQTWKGTNSNSWNLAGNWSPSGLPSGAVTFDGTGINLNTTLGASFTVNSLNFTSGQTAAVTINTVLGNTLTFNTTNVLSVAAGNHKFVGANGGSSAASDWSFGGAATSHVLNVANAASFEIAGRIGGSGSKTYSKTGTGTLILSGNNGGGGAWQHGGLTVQGGGALRFAASFAGGNSGNSYTVFSLSALELQGGSDQALNNGTYTLSGTGIGSTGALRSISGNNRITGSGTGGISLSTSSTGIGVDAGSLTIQTVVKGTGGLTKVGSGTLTLTNASNSYAGATLVSGGTLAVNGSLTLTSGITVGTGATLQGSGSINSSVTIQNGGVMASGNSIESLTVGTLNLQAGSTFAYEINSGASLGVAGDLTSVTGNLEITNGAKLTIADLGTGGWNLNDKLTLISYTGTWNNNLLTYLGSTVADGGSLTSLGGYTWLFDYNDTLKGSNYESEASGSYVTMKVIAVPEPAVSLLSGLGVSWTPKFGH